MCYMMCFYKILVELDFFGFAFHFALFFLSKVVVNFEMLQLFGKKCHWWAFVDFHKTFKKGWNTLRNTFWTLMFWIFVFHAIYMQKFKTLLALAHDFLESFPFLLPEENLSFMKVLTKLRQGTDQRSYEKWNCSFPFFVFWLLGPYWSSSKKGVSKKWVSSSKFAFFQRNREFRHCRVLFFGSNRLSARHKSLCAEISEKKVGVVLGWNKRS